jgi:recombination protein RecA
MFSQRTSTFRPIPVAPANDQQPRFCWQEASGRLVEISGNAALTVAIGWVRAAQEQGDLAAWVTKPASLFFPPDVAASGVDLGSLVTVRVPDDKALPRACERLLRSGAFGLVVMDMGRPAELSLPAQGRLLSLAQKHDAALLCLTDKTREESSLGSMVSLRAVVSREPAEPGRLRCKAKIVKDKRRGPHWSDEEMVLAPPSLR